MVRIELKRVLFCLGCAGMLVLGAHQARAQVQPAVEDTSAASGQAKDRDAERAVQFFWPMLLQHPEGQNTRVGYAHLLKGDFSDAKEVFHKVLSRQEAYAPAHFGMALASYRTGMEEGDKGTFAEQTLYHANQTAVLFPAFEGSYRLLGKIYTDIEDYENAVDAYVRCLAASPTREPELMRAVATAYIKTGSFSEIRDKVQDELLSTGNEIQLLPVVAQACASQGALDLAMQYYGRAFSKMPVEMRQRYHDVDLIASEDELEAYRRTAEDPVARREFLARFWAKRDPDLMTTVNERKLEHYRRVWYAMADFSVKVKPWDRRGEVYVRYGTPDYRSRSGEVAPPMPPHVERIKEAIAHDLYGPEGMGEVGRGPVFPIQRMHEVGMDFPSELAPGMDEGAIEATDANGMPFLEDDPLAPANMSALDGDNYKVTLAEKHGQATGGDVMTFIKWESWVYTGVNGGIEIVFTDEWSGGRFDYAPLPPPDQSETGTLRKMSRLVKHSPAVVMRRSITVTPEYYLPGGREAFLDFYYDRATFRGEDGNTRVEVYYGMSPKSLTEATRDGQSIVELGCAFALFDPETGATLQRSEDLAFRTTEELARNKGAFIPNQLSIEVPAGIYEMRVQVKDLVSGKSGIYKERLEVEAYHQAGLKLSGLELGWHIGTEGGQEKYDKGNGIWVIPMTTKSYQKNQHPFVYYEAYGFTPDAFGQSRYKLEYTIHSEPEKGGGFGRLVAGVGSLFRRGERSPEVSVSTDQVRTGTDLQEYFEMDLKNAKSGVNRLTVRVMDQVSGAETEKEVLFRLERD
ncbi:MAG: GWxTD domain-containing protein [bacterium]|nr:GWxTD domain-containing protein [bacterium]